MNRLTYFIHPHFLQNYYLQRDIKNTLSVYPFKGSLLDIGCGNKPHKPLFITVSNYAGIDFKNYSKNNAFTTTEPDYFFPYDYTKTFTLPFRNDQFNNTVSFQVLEHHVQPNKMISEMVRITKSKGFILLTCPFIWSIHESPHDYYRFTKYALINLFESNNCKVILIKKQGSLPSVMAILLMNMLIEISEKNNFYHSIAIILYPCILVLSYAAILFDYIFKSNSIFLNYLILAKKL